MPRTPGFKDDGNSRLSSRRNFGVLFAGTALLLAGCNTVGASPAPSETAPTSAPASPGSATPGASETSAAEIPNSNIKSLKESAEYKALSPEKKAIIDKYDAMDLATYKTQTSPDRYVYGDFAFSVYLVYTQDQIKKHYSLQDSNSKKLLSDVLVSVGDGKLTSDPEGQHLASVMAMKKAVAAWSTTLGGDTKVVAEKVPTAQKILFNLSVDSFQTEASFFDGKPEINQDNDGLLKLLAVDVESPAFTAPRTGNTTKILQGVELNSSDSATQQQVYEYVKVSAGEGVWRKNYSVHKGESGYLTETQLKDAVSLGHNTNI